MFNQVIFDPGVDNPALVRIKMMERKDNPSEIDIMACDLKGKVLYTIASINARGVIDPPASAVTWGQWIAG